MIKCRYCKKELFLGPATQNWHTELSNEYGLKYYCGTRQQIDPYTYSDHAPSNNLDYFLEKYEELTKK